MSKASDKKFDAYVSTFYVLRKSFHEKPTFFVSYIKMMWCSKMALYDTLFFVFFTQSQKMSIFHETWHTHIEY
jgi:hypothetical protein